METKTKLRLLAAGLIITAGAGILALSTGKGKQTRKKIKRKVRDFFNETDHLIAKAKARYAEVEQQLRSCENKKAE